MKTRKGKPGHSGLKPTHKNKARCHACGEQLRPGSNACTKCGSPVPPERLSSPIDHESTEIPAPKLLGDKVLAFSDSHESERKYVTILVADIGDYSSISMDPDPEARYKVVAHCFGVLREKLDHYGGVMTQVTKGIVKGLFGVPATSEDHAERACEAALSILESIRGYELELRKKDNVELRVRIGLVSGVILTGSVSGAVALEYKDLEDVDDLIATVQSVMLIGKIVATKSTYDLARAFFEFRPIEECDIPDREPTPEAYELLHPSGFVSSIHAKQARGLTKFVGREQEMSVLLAAAARTREGFGQVVAITGDAGVGKSRLAFEFRKRLPEGNRMYLEGYCRSYDGVPPYHPFLDVMRSYFGVRVGESESAVKAKIQQGLSRLTGGYEKDIAPLHEVMALNVEDKEWDKLQPGDKKKRIFEAMETLLTSLGRRGPAVLVLEDLHWIDRTSEEFLHYLVGRIKETRILLVLLYRPEYTPASCLGSSLTQIHLDQVHAGQIRELVESIVGSTELDDSLLSMILNKAGGNPLFVEEFTRALWERGAIQLNGDNAVLTRDMVQEPVPVTIQGVISARMDLLGKAAKETLQAASVMGREFSIGLLERVARAGEDLSLHISRLRELEFIYEAPETSSGEFVFKHALTQEAAYNSLVSHKKRRIHQEIGRAIEEMFPDRLEERFEILAHHYYFAEDWDKAYRYLESSGDKAGRKNSPSEAFYFYKEAYEVSTKMSASEGIARAQIGILLSLDWVARFLNWPEGAEALLVQGEKLAAQVGDRHSLGAFRSSLYVMYHARGETGRLQEYAGKCSEQLDTLGDRILSKKDLEVFIPLVMNAITEALLRGQFKTILPVILKFVTALEQEGCQREYFGLALNPYLTFVALGSQFLVWTGNFEEGYRLNRGNLAMARELGDACALGWLELSHSALFVETGEAQKAIDHAQTAIGHFRQGGITRGNWIVSCLDMLGTAHGLAGDYSRALQYLEEAREIQHDTGVLFGLSRTNLSESLVYMEMGDFEKARNCAESALDWSQKCDQKHAEGISKVYAGASMLKAETLQAAKAEKMILDGIEILKELDFKPYLAQGYLYLGELYLEVGRRERGSKIVNRAGKMFKKMGMDFWVSKAQALLDRFEPVRT